MLCHYSYSTNHKNCYTLVIKFVSNNVNEQKQHFHFAEESWTADGPRHTKHLNINKHCHLPVHNADLRSIMLKWSEWSNKVQRNHAAATSLTLNLSRFLHFVQSMNFNQIIKSTTWRFITSSSAAVLITRRHWTATRQATTFCSNGELLIRRYLNEAHVQWTTATGDQTASRNN